MNNLKIDQKREYLQILLGKGREAAEAFLEESKPVGSWFLALSFEMRLEILRFLSRIEHSDAKKIEGEMRWYSQNGVEITSDVFKILRDCLDCCSGDGFSHCLEERRAKLQNSTLKDG